MATALLERRLGESIPADTPHAVSVTLPTWRANVGYEEGQQWVVSKMSCGYPRFFVHPSISAFATILLQHHGVSGDAAMLFPTRIQAARCARFLKSHASSSNLPEPSPRVIDLEARRTPQAAADFQPASVSAVMYPKVYGKLAKSFWQHTGEGISSRLAEYCHKLYLDGVLVEKSGQETVRPAKGPKRYQRANSADMGGRSSSPSGANGTNGTVGADGANGESEGLDRSRFLEERFGRNLDTKLASDAKLVIRRRIAGSLTSDAELEKVLSLTENGVNARNSRGLTDNDVYLYPGGMNAIYNTHRTLMTTRTPLKSIVFGFPYIDTLKVIEKFGPGALFYGWGLDKDLDDLEQRLQNGERYLALFCEFPSNPVLRTPNIQRIKVLADEYDFYVVVDETIGNFLNVDVLPYTDVMVSSLTKIFSGDSNVMGGSTILNPQGRHYDLLKQAWDREYDDIYWAEDAIFMERNSRDFVSRAARINENAEAIFKQVYYPKVAPTREYYDKCRRIDGGYGGLLSATFHNTHEAASFYDNLDTEKGPSLGTNFTLASPYVILAHYTELEWAASVGVESDLVRFSVGLEDTEQLLSKFRHALSFLQ